MTIDETPRGPGSGSESPGMGRSRSTARDLERYAGLFARRTQGMKSSAMRDMMAITSRPEIISLAGGLPDTSTFPAELLAKLMSGVAAESSARAEASAATRAIRAATSSAGNVVVSGSPPASEMISGRAVIAIMSRMAEDFMPCVRRAKSPA